MKVSLVVASGVHQGKVVPIVGSQFLVGRDPQCHLRPASQAVSKQHCAILVRDGVVYLKDFGSTNGTVLNGAIVRSEERALRTNDSLVIGPLDFLIRIEPTTAKEDGTPLPEMNPEASAAIAAVKAATSGVASKPPQRDATPAPKPPAAKSPVTSKPTPGSKESPALKPTSKEPSKSVAAEAQAHTSGAGGSDEAEHDRLAAMLLGLDDGEIPGGNTVVDVPIPLNLGAEGATTGESGKPAEEKASSKKPPTREDTSNAASEILRKMMRRPK